MSTLRVNKIFDISGNGRVEFTRGMNFPSNVNFRDTTTSTTSIGVSINSSTGILSCTTFNTTTTNLSGVCTATTFIGNANLGITGLTGLRNSRVIALSLIT